MIPPPQFPSVETSWVLVGAGAEVVVVVIGSSGVTVLPGPVGRGRFVGMLESGAEQVPNSDKQLAPQ